MAAESPSVSDAPPPDDHFAVLGLPRRHAVSRDAVEDAYVARARAWHPDRFVTDDRQARARALSWASAVNEAYRVVRDPVRRAEYLVRLAGIDLDSSEPVGGAPSPGQTFLVDMIERREALVQVRARGATAMQDHRADVEHEAEEALYAAVAALEAGDRDAAARRLVQRRYLARLLEEIDAA